MPEMLQLAHEFRRNRSLLACLLGASALLVPAIVAAPASATGEFYPGETLSLAQSGPAVVGQADTFVASGQSPDEEIGGYALNVFQKDPHVDPTCGPTYLEEENTHITEIATEHWPVVGLFLGQSTKAFSEPFKIVPEHAGPMLLCGYLDWVTDTAAAAAPLTVEVATAPAPASNPESNTGPSTNAGSNTGVAAKPADTKKPHVIRSGGKLTCNPGIWSGDPTYTYSWLLNGHRQNGDRGRTLGVSHKLRGHKVQCSVTAANAAGKETAVSSPYHVH
jgi:hypothetical protein